MPAEQVPAQHSGKEDIDGLWCGVPDIEFTSRSEEIIPEIVFNVRTGDITDYLNKVFADGVGTGKTLLATNFAIKEAEKGRKVLYLTYNKNLSSSIQKQTDVISNMKAINIRLGSM